MSVRWDPFRDLITISEHMDRLFDSSPADHHHEGGVSGWRPPVDVCECENEVRLYMEIAGMAADTIDIRVEKNRLLVRGERRRTLLPLPTGSTQ